jgi:uncharacterized protein YjbI with pentapeptide repeats
MGFKHKLWRFSRGWQRSVNWAHKHAGFQLVALLGVGFAGWQFFEQRRAQVEATHFQAWQTISAAQGKPGSGGRRLALEKLNNAGESLAGADLSGRANLSGIDLRGANLQQANLAGANLQRADLKGANLSVAFLKDADLTGADLSSARLWSADLSSARLWYADLTGAVLKGADLSSAILWYADLTDADLGGADLSGADLSGASLAVWLVLYNLSGASCWFSPLRAAVVDSLLVLPDSTTATPDRLSKLESLPPGSYWKEGTLILGEGQ